MHTVGRSHRVYLAFLALLWWPGCLLFTDPINRAPEVKDVRALDPIVRFGAVDFTATIRDDKDSLDALDIEWAEFFGSESCQSITQGDWVYADRQRRAGDQPYTCFVDTLDVVCICVQATDRNGASSFACARVEPTNLIPNASIVDVSGKEPGQMRRLCSAIHLAAQEPAVFPKEELEFKWSLEAPAEDRTTQLVPCSDVKDEILASRHRCFSAAAAGTYKVKLSITDTPTGFPAQAKTSPEAIFSIPVSEDAPPCLRRTDPEVRAQTIMLSSDDEIRKFEVVSVDDDCEPFPLASGSKKQTRFVWSWSYGDPTAGDWNYPAETTESFMVSRATFPDARRGDTVKVRVEVRDDAVERSYLTGHKACPSDETDICVEANSNDNECVRWTTWMVYLLP